MSVIYITEVQDGRTLDNSLPGALGDASLRWSASVGALFVLEWRKGHGAANEHQVIWSLAHEATDAEPLTSPERSSPLGASFLPVKTPTRSPTAHMTQPGFRQPLGADTGRIADVYLPASIQPAIGSCVPVG
jgi:hypothetical protein